MRTALQAVVLAVLVLAAGCVGSQSPTTEKTPVEASPTTTAAAGTASTTVATTVPTTTTATPTTTVASDSDLPPGVNASGLADATQLLQAHAAALDGTARRVHAILRVASDGAVTRSMNRTVHWGGDDPFGVVLVRGHPGGAFENPYEQFARGPAFVWREFDSGDAPAHYRYIEDVTDPRPLTAEEPTAVLAEVLPMGAFEVTGTTTRNGTRLVELEATESAPGHESVTDYSATLLVSQQGVVHSLSGSSTVRADDDPPARWTFSYELDREVDSPSIPAWAGNVSQPVPVRWRAGNDGDTLAIAIEHRGGPAIPAGTSLRVSATPGGEADLTLPERLVQGDAVYLFARESPDGPVWHLSPTEPTLNESFVSLSNRRVYVAGTTPTLEFDFRLWTENDRQDG